MRDLFKELEEEFRMFDAEDDYLNELKRLKVWRQELRQEIGSIRSEIEEWDCREDLTGHQVWELHREINDLHSDIDELIEREKVIQDRARYE